MANDAAQELASADGDGAEVNPWTTLKKQVASPPHEQSVVAPAGPPSELQSEVSGALSGVANAVAKVPPLIPQLGGLQALDQLLGGGQREAVEQKQKETRLTEPNPWSAMKMQGQVSSLLSENTGLAGELGNFMKFGGHSFVRGLAEGLGMPVDTFNTAGEFLRNNPAVTKAIANVAGPIGLPVQAQLAMGGEQGVKPVYAGSGKSFLDAEQKAGLPISTPKEEGIKGSGAFLGDVMGEFVGANVPFVVGAPEKIMAQGVEKTVPNIVRIMQAKHPLWAAAHDHLFGALGPGMGAAIGMEVAGDEHEEAGKVVGGLIGALRPAGLEAALHGAKEGGKKGVSWLHDFLGLGTGAETKVGGSLARATQDLPKARAALETMPELSPGADLPTSVIVGDDGLTALVRTVAAKDAELSGMYSDKLRATERALEADKELSRGNFADTQSWLDAKHQKMVELANRRASQAVEEAERNVEQAFLGTASNSIDANVAKQAYSNSLRRELLLADKDMDAVVQAKWNKVDKEIPVDLDGVYDDIARLKAEHKARPGQSEGRFPSEFMDRFFEKDGSKKFGPGTRLQEAIDLDSEVQQALRFESAKDAPDTVYLGYLRRLQKSLYTAKTSLPQAADNEMLRDALNATKAYHQTFHQGPVAQAMGHDVPGAPNIFPGDTIKHFLSQGPGGIDSFDALMKAVQQRTGAAPGAMGGKQFETSGMKGMLEKYLRQDFYDNAMANGHFDPAAAKRWLGNNSGGMLHFDKLRKEFEAAAKSQERAIGAEPIRKQELETLRKSRTALYLGNESGKLLNGALTGPNKYKAMKDLVAMAKDDPTGRAVEGLAQSALDHMFSKAVVHDKSSNELQRINGFNVAQWMEEHKGVVRALEEAMPGISKRFERIANTAKYIERFHVKPKVPSEEGFNMMTLTSVMARIMGANALSRFGHHGGSIQTAAIGSQAFKQLAAKLTPDHTMKILREAMVDPKFFDALVSRAKNEAEAGEKMRIIQPYMYSMGIPFSQSMIPVPQGPAKKPEDKYNGLNPDATGIHEDQPAAAAH